MVGAYAFFNGYADSPARVSSLRILCYVRGAMYAVLAHSGRKRSGFGVQAIPDAPDRFQANFFVAVLGVLHIVAKPRDRDINCVI